MKVHELMSELSKLNPNSEIYKEINPNTVEQINGVELKPLNLKKHGDVRFYPYGDGVKRCKTKSIVIF